jgi:hypothetical protein
LYREKKPIALTIAKYTTNIFIVGYKILLNLNDNPGRICKNIGPKSKIIEIPIFVYIRTFECGKAIIPFIQYIKDKRTGIKNTIAHQLPMPGK